MSCIHVFHSTTSHGDKYHDASHPQESEPSVMSNNAHLVHWCSSVHSCAQQVQTDRQTGTGLNPTVKMKTYLLGMK